MSKAYQVITDSIIDLLEKGTVPWQKPWGGKELMPKSLVSGKPYRGINSFLLNTASYDSPYWITYKQASGRGGHVKKGEKGYPCIYWNWLEWENPDTDKLDKIPFLKYYTVFNVEQCENIDYPKLKIPEREYVHLETCEDIVLNMPNRPLIIHNGNVAKYSPTKDEVTVPRLCWLDKAEAYYATLYHELIHATGHEKRLGRHAFSEWAAFGTPRYCREELVAEMGSAFLCGVSGIENAVIDNSAAYIDHWLKQLKEDSRYIVHTASQAQKAADYILGTYTPDESQS